MSNIHDSIVTLLQEAQELSFGEDTTALYENEKAMSEKLQEVEDLMRPLLQAKLALQTAIEQSKKRRTGLLYVQSLKTQGVKQVAPRARGKQSKPKAAPSINSLVASLSPDQANALLAALQGMANK